jgi:hypothetical protein
MEDLATDAAVLRAPRPLHPMAVHPRTARMRVLTALPDGTLSLAHRYETWVDFASRPLAPRVDLTPLADRLQEMEERPGRWLFEGVDAITPRLFLAASGGRPGPSSIGADRLLSELASAIPDARAA